jgi:outer membrane lipoprotein SlyB
MIWMFGLMPASGNLPAAPPVSVTIASTASAGMRESKILGAGAGYEGGGVPGAIAGAAAGRAFKTIGNRSTLNAVDRLDTLIRSSSPEAMKIAAQNPQVMQALPPNQCRRFGISSS